VGYTPDVLNDCVRASGFDMEVRYHNRRPVASVPWGYEPQLKELARWSDSSRVGPW